MNKPTILRCYVIPHQSTHYYIAGKYNDGFNTDINPLAVPRCDLDGVLAAMGVVSYSDIDGIIYLTGYGIDLMQKGVKWLDVETDVRMRKYYSIK